LVVDILLPGTVGLLSGKMLSGVEALPGMETGAEALPAARSAPEASPGTGTGALPAVGLGALQGPGQECYQGQDRSIARVWAGALFGPRTLMLHHYC